MIYDNNYQRDDPHDPSCVASEAYDDRDEEGNDLLNKAPFEEPITP